MEEAEEQGRVEELSKRLARLQMQLDAQRRELAELRTELSRLQPAAPASDYIVPSPSFMPEAAPPPPQAVFQTPSPIPVAVPQTVPVDPKPEAHRSLENRIGSQWFSRIGIVALLIGVAWFLKLAIDNHWIHSTPTGRIIAGLLVGAGIVLWSERFRRKGYGAFSFSLKAVGTGTLYLSLWASFQMYHLLPASVALIAMIGVTAWNAIMAWAQDSELLAAYALVGGFATPALLGSGGNHEIFLFFYVLAMDFAALFLLWKKPWQRLLFGSFSGTVIYFIGWYEKFFTADQAGLTGVFVLLLAAPFVAVAFIGKQREDANEGVLAPLAGAAFLSLALYSVLQDSGRHEWLPWVAVALAAVYLLLMRVRRAGIAEAMHLALAIIFLTVAIPLKAEGHWITIGWLAEGIALLWVAVKLLGSEVQPRVRGLLRWLGCTALALGVAGTLVFGFDETVRTAFWNARFATELFAAAAVAFTTWLAWDARRVRANDDEHWGMIAAICLIAFNLLIVLIGIREILTYFDIHATGDGGLAESFTISAWLMFYAAVLLFVGFWKRRAFVRWQGLGLIMFTMGKVFLYDMRNLSSGYRVLSFIVLGALLMAVSFAYQKDWLKLRDDDEAPQ